MGNTLGLPWDCLGTGLGQTYIPKPLTAIHSKTFFICFLFFLLKHLPHIPSRNTVSAAGHILLLPRSRRAVSPLARTGQTSPAVVITVPPRRR